MATTPEIKRPSLQSLHFSPSAAPWVKGVRQHFRLQTFSITHFHQRNRCGHNLKKTVLRHRMDSYNLAMGIIFLSQSTVGILGNITLLSCHLFLYYSKGTVKPIDWILMHLTIANSLIILSKGVPHTVTALGFKQFFNDLICKHFLYIQRVSRNVSIGMTCFLSVFQAVIISPRNSCWQGLKVQAPKYVVFSIYLCWILYMAVNFIFPLYTFNKWNSKNITKKEIDFEYCSTAGHDEITKSLYTVLFLFPEVLFSVLIVWSSGSMTAILYRHKQQVQYIYRAHVSHRSSPESRATQNILALVSTFLGFYSLSSILNACIALLRNPDRWLVNITAFISLCFPSFGSLVLMSRDSTILWLNFTWIRNKISPHRVNM